MRFCRVRPTATILLALAACAQPEQAGVHLVFPGSNVGAEGAVLIAQITRFEAAHPGVTVELRPTPDSADERHQLYVQWLNAGLPRPDVLQLDVIWTAEMAAAGWLLPLDDQTTGDFFPRVLEADRWEGRLYALPWFVDAGMIYRRSDLIPEAPQTFTELIAAASKSGGFVWQGARYEGLVTVFVEILGAYGGTILDEQGHIAVDSAEALAALKALKSTLDSGASPRAVLTWREEQARFAFQNGQAAVMRNWPYAAALLQDKLQFEVSPLPKETGRATATLGGAQLAINKQTRHPNEARALINFLTAPEQMIERAKVAGQFPARRSVYERIEGLLPIPARDALAIAEAATPRPVTPLYTELSEILQVWLHRALSDQVAPEEALQSAAREMRAVNDRLEAGAAKAPIEQTDPPWAWLAAAALAVLFFGLVLITGAHKDKNSRLALYYLAPALAVISLVAAVPLLHTFWESLHHHDLRFPWLGQSFAAADNYLEALRSERVFAALGRTFLFTAATVSLELVLGLVFALLLNRLKFGRGLARTIVLLPWALPTVVAALLFRFLFESDKTTAWLAGEATAWVPLILSDVWKTTPFVALILLAGLQSIDPALYEAADVDGAGPLRRLFTITLPLLKPAILVAALFRTLDAFRVFASVFTLTGGGPGTATEPIALLTYNTLLQHLRFGYGSALAVIVFVATAVLAAAFIKVLGADPTGAKR